MPVSSFGYVLDRLIELEFIVVDTRIDARNSETKLKTRLLLASLDTRFDNAQRNLINNQRGFETLTLTQTPRSFSWFVGDPTKDRGGLQG
jgi:hypothetical protein